MPGSGTRGSPKLGTDATRPAVRLVLAAALLLSSSGGAQGEAPPPPTAKASGLRVEIAPPPEAAVPPDAQPSANAAVPAERLHAAAGSRKRGWLVALAVLLILVLAFAAFRFLA